MNASRRFGFAADTYDMFGHSAGGQILHRYALFDHDNRANRLIAANAGWYTLPDFDTPFPYGLKNSPASKSGLREAFKAKLVVFLGVLDNADETRGHLARNDQVDVQGLHRFARGNHFFKRARDTALYLGTDFQWQLHHVPDVGHDYARMSQAAGEFLYR